MNSDQDKLAKALREVAIGSRRNKTARLREVFDEVEAAKAAGASNKTIVATLEANGLIFDVNNFKNARSRILKERAIEALTRASPIHKTTVKKEDSSTTPPPASPAPSHLRVVDKPPGVTEARWSEMKAEARAAERRQKLNQVS